MSLVRGGPLGSAMVVVIVLLMSVSSLSFVGIPPVRGQGAPVFSSVYLSPVRSGGPSLTRANSNFTVNVMLNLTESEFVNAFDVVINYTLPHIVLKPGIVDYSKNIFQGLSTLPSLVCVDGLPLNSSQSCDPTDLIGNIHVQQILLGTQLSGPIIAGLLFSVQFTVGNNGTSTFLFDHAFITSPGSDPSQVNVHLVPVVTMGAIFANRGVVSFFNFGPTSSQAFLPGETIVFSAGGSFNANDSSVLISKYSWDFGDGTKQNATVPVITHVFSTAANYTVTLFVTDTKGSVGPPVTETVSIVKAVGAIILGLRTVSGQSLSEAVTVQLYNSSSDVTPFEQAVSTTSATFVGLRPGSYFLKISGSTISDYSKSENVQAGLTTPDTAYLTVIVPQPSAFGLIFYTALAAALVVLVVVIVVRRLSEKKQKGSRSQRKTGRLGKKFVLGRASFLVI